jgi:glutamate-1-semialdehyde 2,1-aminomutase
MKTKERDHSRLLAELTEEYPRRFPESARLHRQACRTLVDGGSHNLRLIEPFPPRIRSAGGARVTDEDGHQILDFWQGHHANILGHNPEVVTGALRDCFGSGRGLQTGFVEQLQSETAEILCRKTGMERVRFTTSGSLATMYAILLARAFTGRDRIMKIGGGWHGAQPWGLVGVDYHNSAPSGPAGDDHFRFSDTEGLPAAIQEEVVVTRFNDADMLAGQFERFGSELACFILEPFVGAGGAIPADREYLHAARTLSRKHGVVLIFDEVIAGFRFHAGLLGQLFGVEPDLVALAKIIGGGMPVAAVAGRRDILEAAGRSGSVRFSGGTYSGHPASLLAAKTMLGYLSENERSVYPYIGDLAARARRIVEAAFEDEDLYARCTGTGGGSLPGSSISTVVFPYQEGRLCKSPEETMNPHICDVVLANRVLQLALLLEDVHVVHGLGSISTAHSESDLRLIEAAYRSAARRIKASL